MSIIKQGHEPIQVDSVFFLIYGQPGIGKSTMGLTSQRPLLLDFDGGFRRISPQHRSHCGYLAVNNWNNVDEVLNDPSLPSYDTLVVDTVGKLLDYLTMHIMKENPKLNNAGSLTLQGYGVLKARFQDFLRRVTLLKKSIIFIAHDKETKEGDATIIRPDIQGGSMASVMREMDLVGYMESVNNIRTISFNPSDRFYGKNTCNVPARVDVSDLNKTTINDMPYSIQKLIQMVKDRQNESNEIRPEYEALINVIHEKISNLVDPDSAAAISDELRLLPIIWDSALQARSLFSARMKEAGISYKKDTGYFYLPKTTEPPISQDQPQGQPEAVAPAATPEHAPAPVSPSPEPVNPASNEPTNANPPAEATPVDPGKPAKTGGRKKAVSADTKSA